MVSLALRLHMQHLYPGCLKGSEACLEAVRNIWVEAQVAKGALPNVSLSR